LIGSAFGTETALGGVGGGSDFVADKLLVFTPNQNASVADTDVIELTLTKVGCATTLPDFRAFVALLCWQLIETAKPLLLVMITLLLPLRVLSPLKKP